MPNTGIMWIDFKGLSEKNIPLDGSRVALVTE